MEGTKKSGIGRGLRRQPILLWLAGIAAQLLPLGYWAGQLGAFR